MKMNFKIMNRFVIPAQAGIFGLFIAILFVACTVYDNYDIDMMQDATASIESSSEGKGTLPVESSSSEQKQEESSSSKEESSSSNEEKTSSSKTEEPSSSSVSESSSSQKEQPSSSSKSLTPPVFSNKTPSFNVQENAPVGAGVGTVKVSNAIGSEEFSIVDESGIFDVNVTSGAISVKKAELDYETKANYSVKVIVKNSDGADTATVAIELIDENEKPSVSNAAFTVAENSASGTLVGTVVADDPDTKNLAFGKITLSLVDSTSGASSLFKIDDSGRITVAQNADLDFEKVSLYYVKVIVKDKEYSDTAVVSIQLTDVEELESSSSIASSSSSKITESSSSSAPGFICGDSTVIRGDYEYATVVINEQCWTKENLRYEPSSGTTMCYGGAVANCETYGRLYDYEAANLACPTGWRLPTKAEYEALADYSGADMYDAGAHFKANSGWTGENGDDLLEFTALPGGKCNEEQECSKMGTSGYWWTSTEKVKNSSHYALYLNGDNSAFSATTIMDNDQYISVRCVKK